LALDEVNSLIREAGSSALEIVVQQNILLDAIEHYQESHTGKSRSDCLKRRDVLTTMDAFGALPHQLAAQIESWTSGKAPLVSALGFEENVLIELAVYINAIYDFTIREELSTIGFDQDLVLRSIEQIKIANRAVARCYGEPV